MYSLRRNTCPCPCPFPPFTPYYSFPLHAFSCLFGSSWFYWYENLFSINEHISMHFLRTPVRVPQTGMDSWPKVPATAGSSFLLHRALPKMSKFLSCVFFFQNILQNPHYVLLRQLRLNSSTWGMSLSPRKPTLFTSPWKTFFIVHLCPLKVPLVFIAPMSASSIPALAFSFLPENHFLLVRMSCQ